MLILGHCLYIDLKPYPSWPRIIIYQIISGIGLGPIFQALIIVLFSLTKPADIVSAAATVFVSRDIATAMSLVFGVVRDAAISGGRIAFNSSEVGGHAILQDDTRRCNCICKDHPIIA